MVIKDNDNLIVFKIKKLIFNHIKNIKETKLNHLDLSDYSSYHKERFLIEKEKELLLIELLEEIENLK